MINRFQNNKEAEKELLLRLEREFPFYPFKSEVILRLISIYYEDQKWEKILEFKTKAEKFIKKLVPYFYYAYIFTGKFEKGDSLLFNYLDSYQKRDSLRIKVSYLLFRNRKTGDALRVLEKVENKNSLDFLYLKIDILARRNKETELIRLYNTVKSRKLKGKIAEVLGNYYLKRNKLKEAELFFRKAYEYLPERDALLFSYLFARWKRGEIKEEQVYREFLDKAKDVEEIKKIRFEYHYYLLKKGKLKEAEKNLSFLLNILEKDEKIMRALKELYEIELYLKHDSFFIEILNKFKNREELMGFVYWLGTRYFIERGLSIDKVFGFLEGIHRVKQDDFYYPYILYNLSRCYVEEKKYKEAQVLLEELCERKDSLGFNALFLMGRIYIYQKNVRELKRVIDKLTQVVDRENSPEIYFLKAELESILGNLEKAMEFYEKAAVLYGERRNKAAEMLLRAALISEGIRREFYLKRALILAEDKSLITEIEDFLKR
jgi:tetratricopeptide (TPR) repeat protein